MAQGSGNPGVLSQKYGPKVSPAQAAEHFAQEFGGTPVERAVRAVRREVQEAVESLVEGVEDVLAGADEGGAGAEAGASGPRSEAAKEDPDR